MGKRFALGLTLIAALGVMASCGKPDGGVYGAGKGTIATYAGKASESINVNETWYPTMTAGVPFSETACYEVITDGKDKVTQNSDGSITGVKSGQVKVAFYLNDNLEKEVTLMVLGY